MSEMLRENMFHLHHHNQTSKDNNNISQSYHRHHYQTTHHSVSRHQTSNDLIHQQRHQQFQHASISQLPNGVFRHLHAKPLQEASKILQVSQIIQTVQCHVRYELFVIIFITCHISLLVGFSPEAIASTSRVQTKACFTEKGI